MIIFSPFRVIFFSGVLAMVGAIFLDGAIYHVPGPRPYYGLVAIGVGIELVACWGAHTALRYICHGIRIFFRGPQ